MTDFVDPTVIAQINGAKDELVTEVAKISANSDTIQDYVDNLPPSAIGEAPSDGKTYGRKDKAWVEVTGGGGGGDATWGSITGTLSDQTDLQNALNAKADQSALDAKANTADLATVATSGSYNDLTGKPTILPDAPADGQQYARINNAWAVVEANLAADPTLLGTVTIEDGANDLVIEQDNSYIYFSRTGAFEGTYVFRFRVGNTGLEFSTDESGTVWTPVGGGASDPTNLGNTSTSNSVTITSSTGSDTTISGAGQFSAGVMTAADKSKLDSLENFNGTYTGDLTVRTNVDNYTVLDPTSGATADFITKFQAWGKFNDPFGDAVRQYDVTFKKDGVYHQDVEGSGAERRLAFVDELPTPTGAETFLELTDTPANYTGQAGKMLVVNTGENALEYADVPSGGGGGTQRILTYSLNASLGSYTPLEDDTGTALSSPTILASLVGSDPDAVLSYWNTNFPDVKMFKICGGRGNTNMPSGFATAEYWDMTICRNTQSTNEVMIYHVKPIAIFDTISATEVGKEYSRTFRSGANKFTGAWVEV